MKNTKTTNNQVIITAIVLILFLYLGKLLFWPTEKEEAQKRISSLATIASFPFPPTVVQGLAKFNTFKSALAPEFVIDANDFLESIGSQEDGQYTKSDLEAWGPIYLGQVQNIEISTTKLKEMGKRSYQLVVITKGKTLSSPFDNAYLVELSFNKEWKITKAKVLAPPKE